LVAIEMYILSRRVALPISNGGGVQSMMRKAILKRVLVTNIVVVFLMSVAASPIAKASRDHKAFAALSARLSEPGGYFDSDNLISYRKSTRLNSSHEWTSYS